MIKSLETKHYALLLFIITLGLYQTSLMKVFYSLEILSLDDTLLIDNLSNNNISLSGLLRPGWQGKYYRPVIDLSFFVEQYLWGGQPFGYRLTNVLIHAFNSILLYLFAKSLLKVSVKYWFVVDKTRSLYIELWLMLS